MIPCRFWQECGLLNGAGCCHHPKAPYGPWVVPDVCNKVCKVRVEGEPMPPAPVPISRPSASEAQVFPEQPTHGPGTELKKLLASIGITESSCNCASHAAEMDRNGPDWCYDNLDLVVGWLRTEAARRRLPFIPLAARLLVLRAIALARHQPYDPPPAPPA